ncbi:MAG: hypothetical protein ABIF10_01755 [Candidatus Woesearchaeota archaeon]
MGKIRELVTWAMLTSAAAGIYLYLDNAKDNVLRNVQARFPEYIARIEQDYGPLGVKPRIVLKAMDRNTVARTENLETIAVNTSMYAFISGRDVNKTVNHELAHLKFLQIADSLGVKTYVVKDNIFRYVGGQAVWAVSEGFADYVSHQQKELFMSYPDCFDLVRPVLDRYGTIDGLKKMLLNLPTDQELKDFSSYHMRLGVR